jgi:hypothetical protein
MFDVVVSNNMSFYLSVIRFMFFVLPMTNNYNGLVTKNIGRVELKGEKRLKEICGPIETHLEGGVVIVVPPIEK